jgi:hypothetical protein
MAMGWFSTTVRRDFVSHMREVASGIDLEVSSIDNERAIWLVPFRGRGYPFAISNDGGRLLFTAISQVKFRPGGIPHAVVQLVRSCNRRLEHWQWDAINGRDHSYLVLKGFFNTAGVTSEVVGEAISHMVAEAAALDDFMAENGLIR